MEDVIDEIKLLLEVTSDNEKKIFIERPNFDFKKALLFLIL